jgi:hypothetical protein
MVTIYLSVALKYDYFAEYSRTIICASGDLESIGVS